MTRTQREEIRASYRPPDVAVLFVGESPPHGGTFFYSGDSNLFRYTASAFRLALGFDATDPARFLSTFMKYGCYLEDLSLEPINHLDRSARDKARRDAVAGLVTRIRAASPRSVICVMEGISAIVKRALVEAGFGAVPFESVCFPNMNHQQAYVRDLAAILRRYRVEGRL